jgi:hypothetical protein
MLLPTTQAHNRAFRFARRQTLHRAITLNRDNMVSLFLKSPKQWIHAVFLMSYGQDACLMDTTFMFEPILEVDLMASNTETPFY